MILESTKQQIVNTIGQQVDTFNEKSNLKVEIDLVFSEAFPFLSFLFPDYVHLTVTILSPNTNWSHSSCFSYRVENITKDLLTPFYDVVFQTKKEAGLI